MKLITDFLTKYYAACVEYACVNSGIRNLLTALNVWTRTQRLLEEI